MEASESPPTELSPVEFLKSILNMPDLSMSDVGEEEEGKQIIQMMINKWDSMKDKVGKCK